MLIKLLPVLLLTLLIAASLSAQDVEAQFATNKTDYLVGEPLFVTLTVTNRGDATIWVDFKSPDAPSFCENFALEVPGAELPDHWGCGYAGSCASSFREIPPGKSLALRRLLNTQFRLQRPPGRIWLNPLIYLSRIGCSFEKGAVAIMLQNSAHD